MHPTASGLAHFAPYELGLGSSWLMFITVTRRWWRL